MEKVTMKKVYQMVALLENRSGGEWGETVEESFSTPLQADKAAKRWGREIAKEQNATLVDAFAVDENGVCAD